MTEYTPKQISRFWKHVDKTAGPQGCWLWTAYRDNDGYGRITWPNCPELPRGAHRVSWELAHGAIPDGMLVLHNCDNPSCVNPAHLWLGSQLDNNRDRENKGRGADVRGEKHPMHKLTAEQVAEIRLLYSRGGISHEALGKRYGVSDSTIYLIIRGKNWSSQP